VSVAFEAFVNAYGRPAAGTAAPPQQPLLPRALQRLVQAGLAGSYGGGALSLLSTREAGAGLGPWAAWLPAGARLFGCTGFGSLFVWAQGAIRLVDTQYGQVIDSPDDLEEFLVRVAAAEARRDAFREPLFRRWVEINGPLAPTDVLSPTPALPLGGDWTLDALRPAHLEVYLALTGQLFGPGTGTEVEYR
jgi:hypothetical protein